MNTLSNVKPCGGKANPPSVGFISDAFPEAKSSKTGVSVRYVHDIDKNWFVFRASYGREDKASDYLIEDGTYTYIAKRYVSRSLHGKKKKLLVSLIPNVLFVYTTKDKAEEYVNSTPALPYISYYYNHLEFREDKKNPPLTISCDDMRKFVLETKNHNEHLIFLDPSQCHYKQGDMVRVIDGTFKGVEGRIARISGQQRVALWIRGLGTIATAYIPTAFLEKI